ncbi:sugar transferase [Methylobacterium sp. BTF04]|uniref:sugar transferase n=1 Tax=Methylobacterium sp. BTF04 TaxID=2708300 RepID=UPI0013D6DF54|nr:sugar transferase [Methylobacterium sp. BTF04]NEU14476.1 sugar transferase [Methylobacterium sp. BTF04]
MSGIVRSGDIFFQKFIREGSIPIRSERKPIRLGIAGKRTLDVSVAALALFLVLPLLVILCTAVWMSDGRSPIFRHRRIGRNGTAFSCLKIRSMVNNSEAVLQRYLDTHPEAREEWSRNHKLVADPRVTRLGRFLRKSSLDELPQLFNVLRGEMSLVGPRPIVEAEISRYGESFSDCFSVPPGITGLWQVSGRSECSYGDRVLLDLQYAQGWHLGRDLQIIFMTVPAVIRQKGSY